MPAKKAPAINPALYQKIVALGTRRGNAQNIPTILGTEDSAVVRLYLEHMKTADAALYKGWGSKWKPAEPVEDAEPEEADDDMFADPPAPKKGKPVWTGVTPPDDDIFGDVEVEEEAPPPPAPKKAAAKLTVEDSGPQRSTAAGMIDLDGVTYPARFRLRRPDGTNADLEVFSKGPKFGFLLQFVVPKDERTITVSGREVTVDLLALQAEPDGTTELWPGKTVANSKLIARIEAEDI